MRQFESITLRDGNMIDCRNSPPGLNGEIVQLDKLEALARPAGVFSYLVE
jgi:hypothetical protein